MSIKKRIAHAIKWISDFAKLQWKVNASKRYVSPCIKEDLLILFDTALQSQNMGDSIIQQYCGAVITELLSQKEILRVPTHVLPEAQELAQIPMAETKIVCGTNLMTPHYEDYSIWVMPQDLVGYRNVITMGVGWGRYCEEISPVSKYVYQTILSKTGLHSVRDSYTEQKFHQMGIHNVVNTGCPTLWKLSPEHCSAIPVSKASRVIATITDYDQAIEQDRKMLEILLKEYEDVFVWIQGSNDLKYLEQLISLERVNVVPRSVEAFTEILRKGSIDYVGTRLHAGIHALNQGVRSLIIAIDNRATEIGRDVNLPILLREDIGEKLVARINAPIKTEIILPEENIIRWKSQFKKQEESE